MSGFVGYISASAVKALLAGRAVTTTITQHLSFIDDIALYSPGVVAEQKAKIAELQALVDGYEEANTERRKLVKMLDIELNGPEGAAEQASLCDLIGQAAKLRASLADAEERLQFTNDRHYHAWKGLTEVVRTINNSAITIEELEKVLKPTGGV